MPDALVSHEYQLQKWLWCCHYLRVASVFGVSRANKEGLFPHTTKFFSICFTLMSDSSYLNLRLLTCAMRLKGSHFGCKHDCCDDQRTENIYIAEEDRNPCANHRIGLSIKIQY